MPKSNRLHRQISVRGVALCLGVMLSANYIQAQSAPQADQQTPQTAPQLAQVLSSYEGQNISTIELAGQPNLDQQTFAPLLAPLQNQPFSRSKIDETIAAIKNAGGFSNIELELRPEPTGVRVLFVLQPAVYFGMYDFPGSGPFAYSRLLQVADYPSQEPYSSVDVQRAREALLKFFRRTGYFLAQVDPEVQTDQQHGLANVIFRTRLNKRAKFGKVTLQGALPQDNARLQHSLRSIRARLTGSAIRAGKTYSPKTLSNAAQLLEKSLLKKDRLAAQVKLIGAAYDPATNRADITFNVQEGPVVHVKVQGAHLWSFTRHRLLPIYQQNGMDPELIQEGRQNLVSYFQSKGYFDAQVNADVQQQQPAGTSVVYRITKGPRHKVKEVRIAGNHHISGKELLSHVKVSKGRWFSHGQYSQKLVHTSANNLKNVYRSAGFGQVDVVPQITNQNGNIAVTFNVTEGPQDIVESFRVEGNNTLPVAQFAPKGLNLAEGQPYSLKSVDEDRDQIVSQYLNRGYLTAIFKCVATPRKSDPHQVDVVYRIYEGPRVETDNVITLGRKHTRQSFINRETQKIQPGKPLSEENLLESGSELYTPAIFDWAEVDLRRQITTQTQEDVLIKLHEAKRNEITYGFGFEIINRGGSVPSGTVALPGLPLVGLPKTFKTSQKTFYGPRGTFSYTRRNIRGKAETMTFATVAGRLAQRGSLTYTDPNLRSTRWSSNLILSGEHNGENPIFTSRLAQFSIELQRPLDEKKTRNFFLRYSIKQTGLTHLLIPELVPAQDQHVRLSTLSAIFTRDTRDNTLDAHKGIYESFQGDFNPSVLGSSVNFGRLLAQTAYYKKIPQEIVWANSIRLGLEQPFAGSHVPLSEKFFTGGGSTLRGFPLDGAGPQRTIAACGTPGVASTCTQLRVPVGGNELFIVNSELRIPVPLKKGLSVVPFYDGGNVYPIVGFHDFTRLYTNTIGGGLRYATPVGPIRFDIGHNLNPISGIKSTQYFVTLGQAF